MSREGRNQVTARPVRGILHGWSCRYRPPTTVPSCRERGGTRKRHRPSMDGAVDLGTYQRATMSREGRNQEAARPVHGWSRRYRPPTNIYCKIARLGRGKFRNILRITWNILRLFQDARPVCGILHGWKLHGLPTCHHEEPGSSTGRLWHPPWMEL